ncbi:meiosis-specific protein ASY2-like isoform X2 [Raphanus sativus]|uniref:Meiosis-specific protein ASY2-like isoform X2 n=1 Tax=Raphanus sativus TaxID=3726 RepID=A0A9W3BYN1_RAPSA|nr:meiosis-specific protein ASY2-like isoform X2 [Raphanus sativus]
MSRRKTISRFFGIVKLVDLQLSRDYLSFLMLNCVFVFFFFCLAVRHPNTIAYPEKFFEHAQAIATLSHRRWPDLSADWIRRCQERVAKEVWRSRLPCVVVPGKKRLSLFTRKQQTLVNKAKKMRQTPDLSAILKGQMRSLGKKKTATVVDDEPAVVNDDPSPVATPVADRDGPASADREEGKEGNNGSSEVRHEPDHPEEEFPEDPVEMAQQKLSKKKKKEKKRSREASSKRETEGSNASHEDAVGPSAKASPGAQPKKQKRGHSSRQENPPMADTAPGGLVDDFCPGEERGGDFTPAPDVPIVAQKKTPRKKAGASRSAPSSSVDASGSFTTRGPRVDFPDRVNFSYDEDTPLIYNPVQCAELTRQVKGGPIDLPPVADLLFKDEYIKAAQARKQSDGSMNLLVEKYETELRRTQAQLGAAEELARAKDLELSRVLAKNAEDKEILRVKFEDLKTKLLNSRSSVKALSREKVTLERGKKDLEKERDAVVAKLISERRRLRDSRVYEVTLERVRVETAMVVKAKRRFDSIRDYSVRRDAFEEAHNLYGQAFGTRKCLELAKGEGYDVSQELIDFYRVQEGLYKVEVDKLKVGDIPESDLSLSPLILPSTFVSEEVLAGLDKYGSNDSIIDSGTLSRMQSPDDSFDIMMKERNKAPTVAEQGTTEGPIDAQEGRRGKDATSNETTVPPTVDGEALAADLVGAEDPSDQKEDPAN